MNKSEKTEKRTRKKKQRKKKQKNDNEYLEDQEVDVCIRDRRHLNIHLNQNLDAEILPDCQHILHQ